ncbi:MAG: hypothetical protein LBV11_05435 [Bacillus cereus]|jgi:hypothetical protein|nr:hypothetical protein [Bacillus cereus]
MKKNILKILPLFLCLCLTFSVSSCSKDDDDDDNNEKPTTNETELLIGRWEQSSTVHWTFDEKYVLIEDKDDVFNGEKAPYTYDSSSKDLVLGGFATYKVKNLTSTELELTGWTNMKFKKVK